jgi:hypothetical protein
MKNNSMSNSEIAKGLSDSVAKIKSMEPKTKKRWRCFYYNPDKVMDEQTIIIAPGDDVYITKRLLIFEVVSVKESMVVVKNKESGTRMRVHPSDIEMVKY